jgi:hypothetical protein
VSDEAPLPDDDELQHGLTVRPYIARQTRARPADRQPSIQFAGFQELSDIDLQELSTALERWKNDHPERQGVDAVVVDCHISEAFDVQLKMTAGAVNRRARLLPFQIRSWGRGGNAPDSRPTGLGLLRLGSFLLPSNHRKDYLEEHHAYLLDLPTLYQKFRWVLGELCSLPRFAYTTRTSTRRERA